MATHNLAQLALHAVDLELLNRFGFDAKAFLARQKELAEGKFAPERNQTHEPIEPPAPNDIVIADTVAKTERQKWHDLGLAALKNNQVGIIVLNGGMATRFGGVVKGVVEVENKKSFLALKLEDVKQAPGQVWTFLLNSFATDKDTREHLASHTYFGLNKKRISLLTQHISMRLNPDGSLYKSQDGHPSMFAPGHGDVLDVLANAEGFDAFKKQGGRYVLLSNVDNLGATLEPWVLGAHIACGKKVTVEVAPRRAHDAGGAPVRVGGRLQVLEGFRFPSTFDMSALSVFNTNTFIFNSEAILPDYDLSWFRADKKVGPHAVVQFERLVGEVTRFVPATYLQIRRDGPSSRFLPVKTPQDLPRVAEWVRSRQ